MANRSSASAWAAIASSPRRRVGHQLGDHRVVVDGDLAALDHAGVDAHRRLARAALGGRPIERDAAGGGQELARGVFGIDARLHRPSVKADVLLAKIQRLAGSHADHRLDEVDAGDEFGDGMLHLQAGVHLQEVEALVLAGDELDRSGRVVAHRLGKRDGLLTHPPARLGIEQRRGRFLDHLLVAALDGAFALVEIDDVAVLVAEQLDLDMARVGDELLDEHAVVAERALRLRRGAREALRDLLAGMGDAHALAAATGGRLDHHGIADPVGDAHGLLAVGDDAEVARHRRDPGGGGELL